MQLYRHQSNAVNFLQTRKRALIALKPGLGKTYVALELIKQTKLKSLIIVPAYLVHNWLSEIQAYCPECLSLIKVISYGSLKNLESKDFSILILDEAHYIKNPQAKRTKFVFELAKVIKPKFTALLTGTPLKNRVPEFYPLLKVLSVGDEFDFPTTYLRFCTTFANKTEKFFGSRKQVTFEGVRNLDLLKRVLTPIYYSVDENEVLDLPAQVRKYVNLDLKIDSEMAQVDISDVSFATLKKENAIAKHSLTAQYLEDLANNVSKIVVFTDHPYVCELLAAHSPFPCGVITGDTPMKDRYGIVEKFNDSSEAVLYCTIGAASVGLNLQTANHMVFNDYPWVAADLEQAEKRIHRIGQNEKCFYHYLLSGEMDKRILNVVRTKKDLIEEIL